MIPHLQRTSQPSAVKDPRPIKKRLVTSANVLTIKCRVVEGGLFC